MTRRTVAALAVFAGISAAAARADDPAAVFEKRILPILKSPQPSSCVQCHLAGVELKNYLRPGAAETFVSLRDQGLVDLDRPGESKILRLIRMDDGSQRPEALVARKVRAAEAEAFAEWIKAAAADPKYRNRPRADAAAVAKPARPDEVVRHARRDHVLERFERDVWALRFRCAGCHQVGEHNAQNLAKKHGEGILWMKATAEATLDHIAASADLLDRKAPEKSPLLLKPLNVLKHGGGQKFNPGDEGDRAFRGWILDYLRTAGDGYDTAEALPKAADDGRDRFGTPLWLKITDLPAEWRGRTMRAEVFGWDTARGDWEDKPLAACERLVPREPNHPWHQTLILIADRGSPRAKKWAESASLPSGRYRVRLRVFSEKGDAPAEVGRLELPDAPWKPGWQTQTTGSFKNAVR